MSEELIRKAYEVGFQDGDRARLRRSIRRYEVSAHTPTTDDVRAAYRAILLSVEKSEFFELIEEQADSEFDRWLEDVKRNAWARGYNEGYSTAEKRSKAGSQ